MNIQKFIFFLKNKIKSNIFVIEMNQYRSYELKLHSCLTPEFPVTYPP